MLALFSELKNFSKDALKEQKTLTRYRDGRVVDDEGNLVTGDDARGSISSAPALWKIKNMLSTFDPTLHEWSVMDVKANTPKNLHFDAAISRYPVITIFVLDLDETIAYDVDDVFDRLMRSLKRSRPHIMMFLHVKSQPAWMKKMKTSPFIQSFYSISGCTSSQGPWGVTDMIIATCLPCTQMQISRLPQTGLNTFCRPSHTIRLLCRLDGGLTYAFDCVSFLHRETVAPETTDQVCELSQQRVKQMEALLADFKNIDENEIAAETNIVVGFLGDSRGDAVQESIDDGFVDGWESNREQTGDDASDLQRVFGNYYDCCGVLMKSTLEGRPWAVSHVEQVEVNLGTKIDVCENMFLGCLFSLERKRQA